MDKLIWSLLIFIISCTSFDNADNQKNEYEKQLINSNRSVVLLETDNFKLTAKYLSFINNCKATIKAFDSARDKQLLALFLKEETAIIHANDIVKTSIDKLMLTYCIADLLESKEVEIFNKKTNRIETEVIIEAYDDYPSNGGRRFKTKNGDLIIETIDLVY